MLTVIVEMLVEFHEESERIAKRGLSAQIKDIPLRVLETRPVGEADEKSKINFADLGRDI